MFTRILLPLDGSPRAEEALRYARALAANREVQLYVLHVEEPTASTLNELATARRLEALATELWEANIAAHVVTHHGAVVPSIAAAIEQYGIDLVALAPETRGLLDGVRHPSVTAQVLTQSTVPLLIIPKDASISPRLLEFGDSQVLVPLDGSAVAEKALPLAALLARRHRRELVLVRVIPPAPVFTAGLDTYALTPDTLQADLRVALDYLRELRGKLERTEHVPVHTIYLDGDPATSLLALAETKPGSMLVMSSHGRTGLARMLLGSVTLEVARKTSIPLVIVPTLKREQSVKTPATKQPGAVAPTQ